MAEGFSKSLKRILRDRNLKQADLCRMTGLDTGLVSLYARGLRDPSLTNAVVIADALQISLDELVGRQPPRREIESRLLGHFRGLNEEGQEVLVNLAFGMKSTYKKRFESGMAAAKGRVG